MNRVGSRNDCAEMGGEEKMFAVDSRDGNFAGRNAPLVVYFCPALAICIVPRPFDVMKDCKFVLRDRICLPSRVTGRALRH